MKTGIIYYRNYLVCCYFCCGENTVNYLRHIYRIWLNNNYYNVYSIGDYAAESVNCWMSQKNIYYSVYGRKVLWVGRK